MKKAYVKPVFLAEEFFMTMSIAACQYSMNNPAKIYHGVRMCSGNNHKVTWSPNATNKGTINTKTYTAADGTVMDYWQYSQGAADEASSDAYLFTVNNGQCDFLWDNSNEQIGVWKTPDTFDGIRGADTMKDSEGNWLVNWLIGTFSGFFYGSGDPHEPAYQGESIVS